MHPNPIFRNVERSRNIAFSQGRAFGTLAVNAKTGPMLSHVPFVLGHDGAEADLHLVRSNPIARMTLPAAAVLSVTGPDGYVSPDWYGATDQVPTWNYIAVHLRGVLEPLPQEDLAAVLDRLTAMAEARIAEKPPWTSDKMSADVLTRMMRQIRPFRLRIEVIDGTWKLNQNKDDQVRMRAADSIENGFGSDLCLLADLMRAPPQG